MLGITTQPLASMQKKEIIYLYGNEDEQSSSTAAPILHLVQLIRDESHALPSAIIASAAPCVTAIPSF